MVDSYYSFDPKTHQLVAAAYLDHPQLSWDYYKMAFED
jgi:hypothetical protein